MLKEIFVIFFPQKYTGSVVNYCLIIRDNQTRRIQENITNVEKHFGEMCQLFAAYVRKTARIRDKADLLVREIGLYADTETPNLKRGMKQYADHLAKIQDYRQAQVDLLNNFMFTSII